MRRVADLLGLQRRTTFYDPQRNGGGMPEMVRFVLHRQFQEPLVHLPPDPAAHGFDSMAESLNLPPFLMEKYLDAAEKLTAREDVRQSFGRRVRPQQQQRAGDPAEIDRFIIADVLKRAFHRPPDPEEVARYTGFYDLAIKNGEDRGRGHGGGDAGDSGGTAIPVPPGIGCRQRGERRRAASDGS